MSRYEFDPDRLYDDGRRIWILDLTGPPLGGCEVASGDIFDPADYGKPDWKPEPYPHPLFRDLSAVSASSPPAPPAAAPAPTEAASENPVGE